MLRAAISKPLSEYKVGYNMLARGFEIPVNRSYNVRSTIEDSVKLRSFFDKRIDKKQVIY